MELDLSSAPNDVLLEIFLKLDSSDVVKCSMVNKQWHSLVSNHRFWFQKCRHDGYLEDVSLDTLCKVDIVDLQKCLALKAFERNLIEDDYEAEPPKFDQRWSDARKSRRKLNEFKIECPPAFLSAQREDTQHLDQCPEPFRACLVSSYSQARRSIAVNLADYGVTPEFLFKYKPKIVVLEYYTNRNDCSCQYTLEAVIRRSGQNDGFYRDRDVEVDPEFGTVTQRERIEIDQWEPQFWRKQEFEFTTYPEGVSVVELSSTGRDGQFWAGNYGVKVAGASIVIKFKFNNQ